MYRRKSTKRRGSGLMPGVSKLARAVNSQLRDQQTAQQAQAAATTAQLLTQAPRLTQWQDGRRDARMRYGGMGMYTGHGGFLEDMGGKLFDKIGPSGLGDLGALGRGLGGAVGKWAGMGSYDDSAANSLIPSGGSGIGVPAFVSSGGESGAICITHREYVSDIFGNGVTTSGSGSSVVVTPNSFVVQTYSINPGLAQTFPWLSQIAQNYDEYTIKQLMFSYRSVVSDIGTSTSGQVGTIIMATNYNAAASPFPDKQTMMEYEAAMSAKTTEHQLHGVECDASKKSFGPEGLYTRTNPVQTTQDLKTYDWGKFQLGVSNTPTRAAQSSGTLPSAAGFENQIIGELWVSYTVELRKPKYFVNRGLGIARDTFSTSLVPTSSAFFSGPLTGQQNNIGIQLVEVAASGAPVQTFTFPANFAGTVRCLFIVNTNTSIAGSVTVTRTGNVMQLNDILQGSSAVNPVVTSGNIYVADFTIANASNGINNAVIFTWSGVTIVAGAHTQVDWVEINPSGLPSLTSTQNVLFVNSNGVLTAAV